MYHKKNNAMFRKISLLLLLLTFISGCASVTIRPQGGYKDSSQADYIENVPFYFAGLVGNHKVDVNEACEGNEVTQMQTITTLSNWLLGLITLTIYSPRTAKVWCEESQ